MDFDGMEEYDFDGKMDFDGMEEYDFDGKMDFDGMEEYDFNGKMDFSEMDQNDEENKLEPTVESPQDPDRDTNTDNNDDQSSNHEQENESYENLNSESTSTILISDIIEEEGEKLHRDDQDHEGIEKINQEELNKEIEKELEEGVEAINQYLEEEAEFINAYQEIVGEARELDGERESEDEEPLKTEEEWEKVIETAAYTAEQLYESMNEIETNANNEELSENNEELEIEKEAKQSEEVSEIQLSNLQEEFEEGMNEIEQHQVEPLIEEALETESEPIVIEKEIEQLQELDLETQFQTVHLNEYVEELVEKKEEDKIEQEKKNIEQTQELLHQPTYLQEKLEEQEQKLELEYEEKEEVEQQQVEAAIEEELETEPKPIIKEEELEYIKNFEPEKQLDAELLYELIEELVNKQKEEKEEHEETSTEEKVAQITSELEIVQEITTSEKEVELDGQEVELKPDTTYPFIEAEEHAEEENRDHQQELEEILVRNSKIEQEALNEIKPKEEDSDKANEKNYEKAKRLYKQQTRKRPIYANQETKGFKLWLEQKKESEEIKKAKYKQDLKEEQKKEEAWKWTLKNRIEEATKIEPELKSELKKLVEEYNEIEKLIKKYSKLYNKAQRKELSQAEKKELNSLIKVLHKLDPIKFELFIGIREIKRYIDEQYYYYEYWNNQRNHRVFSHFFTHLTQRYKNIKAVQKKEIIEEILENWIEEASEEEISLEMKVVLIEILENYNDLEELAANFMKLNKKEKLGQISKSEKMELKSSIKTLEKMDPINIELFANIRAIKCYLNDQQLDNSSEKTHVNRILNRFFTSFSQKYKENNQLDKHLKDVGSVNKKAHAKELVSNMKKQRIENLKELGYDGSIPIEKFVLYKRDIEKLLQKGIIKDIADLIGVEGKIRYGFVGFTYRAIDKKSKFFQTGLSFTPHPFRLGWYLHDIIFNPKRYLFRRTGTNQIYGWIAEAIDSENGLQTLKGDIKEGNINSILDIVGDLFDFEITGVFWDEKFVRRAENEQIAVSLLKSGRKGLKKLINSLGLGYDIVNPSSLDMKKITEIAKNYRISKDMIAKGLNDPTASGVGGNTKNAERFIWECGYYTALGMAYRQMHEAMKQRGLYRKSLQSFSKEYRKWFGSIKQGRELFLAPICKTLRELHGYSEGDINRLYPLYKKFNIEQFVHLTEENYELGEIAEIMGFSVKHMGGDLVPELIIQNYGFIEQYLIRKNKKQKSFKDLQWYLIAQKILRQVMVNIPKNEIKESFEGGITDYQFIEIHRKVLRTQTFTNLQDFAREALLKLLILDINPSKITEIIDDGRCWMPGHMIYRKFKQFYGNNPLVQRILVKKNLLPLEMAKVAIFGTELEKYYKKGFSDTLILKKLNNKYTLKEMIELTKLIWNRDPNSVRSMLHTGILKEK